MKTKTYPSCTEALRAVLDQGGCALLSEKEVRRGNLDVQAIAISLGAVLRFEGGHYVFQRGN